MKLPLRVPITDASAFTLVEIALALGIVGFACVSLVGLLSIGLNCSRANVDRNVLTQIVGTMKGTVRAAISVEDTSHLEEGFTARYNDYGVGIGSGSTQTVSFAAVLSATAVTLPGGTTPITSWTVTVSSPVRNHKQLEKSVFWSAP